MGKWNASDNRFGSLAVAGLANWAKDTVRIVNAKLRVRRMKSNIEHSILVLCDAQNESGQTAVYSDRLPNLGKRA